QALARRGLLTVERLAMRLDSWRRSGCRGVLALEQAIARNSDMPTGESFLESAFLRLLRTRDMPMPEVQVEIELAQARYRVDCLYPEHELVVELKGFGTHSTRAELNEDSA